MEIRILATDIKTRFWENEHTEKQKGKLTRLRLNFAWGLLADRLTYFYMAVIAT